MFRIRKARAVRDAAPAPVVNPLKPWLGRGADSRWRVLAERDRLTAADIFSESELELAMTPAELVDDHTGGRYTTLRERLGTYDLGGES